MTAITQKNTTQIGNPFDAILEEISALRADLAKLASSTPKVEQPKRTLEEDKVDTAGLMKYLGKTRVTIYSLKKRGAIRFYGSGRSTYFFISEINEDLASVSRKKRKDSSE